MPTSMPQSAHASLTALNGVADAVQGAGTGHNLAVQDAAQDDVQGNAPGAAQSTVWDAGQDAACASATAETSATAEHRAVIEIVEPLSDYPVGAKAQLMINVRCPEACDLAGGTILIGNEDDQIVAEQYLAAFDEGLGANTTGYFTVQIPAKPGEYTWAIMYFPAEADSAADPATESAVPTVSAPAGTVGTAEHANSTQPDGAQADGTQPKGVQQTSVEASAEAPTEASLEATLVTSEEQPERQQAPGHAIIQAEYRFKAHQHTVGMSVYRNYQPVTLGAHYTITVNAECLSGCSLLGQAVSVHCNNELLATAQLDEPKDPSTKLYQTDITLAAPQEVGMYELTVGIEPTDMGLAHASNQCLHYVTTQPPAQCCLALTVLNSESRAPLAGVDLTVHPTGGYPSWWVTNQEGTVSVDTTWGECSITASLENYEFAHQTIVLEEGQGLVELTIPLVYHPPLFA